MYIVSIKQCSNVKRLLPKLASMELQRQLPLYLSNSAFRPFVYPITCCCSSQMLHLNHGSESFHVAGEVEVAVSGTLARGRPLSRGKSSPRSPRVNKGPFVHRLLPRESLPIHCASNLQATCNMFPSRAAPQAARQLSHDVSIADGQKADACTHCILWPPRSPASIAGQGLRQRLQLANEVSKRHGRTTSPGEVSSITVDKLASTLSMCSLRADFCLSAVLAPRSVPICTSNRRNRSDFSRARAQVSAHRHYVQRPETGSKLQAEATFCFLPHDRSSLLYNSHKLADALVIAPCHHARVVLQHGVLRCCPRRGGD